MNKIKVLFVCIHNSARSQMAEAFLNHSDGNKFDASSAGLEPGSLNPVVVDVMKELGIDISGNTTNSVAEFLNRKDNFDYVITVCDETAAERCPLFPGGAKRLHWGFADPSSLGGTAEEKITQTRQIRDQIKAKVDSWVASLSYDHPV